MIDFFATLGIFTGILLFIVLGLYLLSDWHRWIEKRLRGITRDDLEREATLAEAGYYDRSPHVRRLSAHVENRNKGRHRDSAGNS